MAIIVTDHNCIKVIRLLYLPTLLMKVPMPIAQKWSLN